jgi:hypothetical protein
MEVVTVNSDIIYSDKLVTITEEYIHFNNYHFPSGSRRVNFSEIGSISVKKPTLLNGKYRYHGTGDFRTWFPLDWERHTRDKIFLIGFPKKIQRIGFTVEDSARVAEILKQKGLIVTSS